MSDISCEREAGSKAIQEHRQVHHNRVMRIKSDERYFLARNKLNGRFDVTTAMYDGYVGSISTTYVEAWGYFMALGSDRGRRTGNEHLLNTRN